MRSALIGIGLALLFLCISLPAETRAPKMTLTGKLTRAMAIGAETTGWAVELESETTIDGKQVHSIEVAYPDSKKLEKLENKRVKAIGRLSHRHGVETGDRLVLDISSIKEAKTR